MNLTKLKDDEVLSQIKNLVQNERHLLTEILHHLREVRRRKLFSELGYPSLFAYAVKELKYSEGQAGRRLQALRLLDELPEVEEKIQSGALTLLHLSQAQSFFREKKNTSTSKDHFPGAETSSLNRPFSNSEKLELLRRLENKSTRESEKIILSLATAPILPKEKERILTPTVSEQKFVITEPLRKKLKEVKSLLGAKALDMNFAQLVEQMADLSIANLRAKKFGKRRTESPAPKPTLRDSSAGVRQENSISKKLMTKTISKALKFKIWQRDQGRCTRCSSQTQLNIDHIHPRALGGGDEFENLRLLCFHCNQRRAIKTFGSFEVKT